MYGEGDPFMITAALKSAQETFGWVIRVGDGNALFQKSYAGNVAWAFLKANEALRLNPDLVGGHFFFIPDETPVLNIFDSLHPYPGHKHNIQNCSISNPLLVNLRTFHH